MNSARTKRQATSKAQSLAETITRRASKQTYATIRLLADRPFAATAYQAYAYFRWLDDILDEELPSKAGRLAFLRRQQQIIARCYRSAWPGDLGPEEALAAELIANHPQPRSGIGFYISEMMAVMAFDAERKGRLISAAELDSYTRALATAVTEALHFCIGHGAYAPQGPARCDAVMGAHITHMLRDAIEDSANGYHNIPREYLEVHDIAPDEVDSPAYRAWVKIRVNLARAYFASGRAQIAQVESLRCRLAGYAYVGPFRTHPRSHRKGQLLPAPRLPGAQNKTRCPQTGPQHAAAAAAALIVIGWLLSVSCSPRI